MTSQHPNQLPYRHAPPSPATAAAALSLGALAAAPLDPPPRPQLLAKAIAPAPLPTLSALSGGMSQASMLAPMRGTPLKPKQKRYRANPDQLRDLVALFELNPSPPPAELAALSARIAMPTQSVVLWFKNRRARVPHKKAEKAEAARRRELQYKVAVTAAASATTSSASNLPQLPASARVAASVSDPRTEDPITQKLEKETAKGPVLPPLNMVAPQLLAAAAGKLPAMAADNPEGTAAALVMAEMAMAKRAPVVPPNGNLAALCNVAMQEASKQDSGNTGVRRDSSTTCSSQGGSRDFAMRLLLPENTIVGNARAGEFALATPRRPRVLPQTPRFRAQLEYHVGDKVEVMDTDGTQSVCRMWYPGTVVGMGSKSKKDVMPTFNLAAIAVTQQRESPVLPPSEKHFEDVETDQETVEEDVVSNVTDDQTKTNADADLSPRTVQSSAASPTPAIAKAIYVVRFEHKFSDGTMNRRLEEEVVASRIRPEAPSLNVDGGNWRPEPGDAVEALLDGAWIVGVMKTHALRKGYLVCFESGERRWIRRDFLRPYQIWRGCEDWVVKIKAPVTVGRKSVGLSVTHMPERRKRSRDVAALDDKGNTLIQSSRGNDGRRRRSTRTKRAKSTLSNEQDVVDGLPRGWTTDSRSNTNGYYVAPDGRHVRSLKGGHRHLHAMESA